MPNQFERIALAAHERGWTANERDRWTEYVNGIYSLRVHWAAPTGSSGRAIRAELRAGHVVRAVEDGNGDPAARALEWLNNPTAQAAPRPQDQDAETPHSDLTVKVRALATELAYPSTDDEPVMGDIIASLCEMVGDSWPRKPDGEDLARVAFAAYTDGEGVWAEQNAYYRKLWRGIAIAVRERMEADGYRRIADSEATA